MNNFLQLPTTRKGYAGEAIAKNVIRRAGWTIYESTADVPHLVDFLCHKAGRLIAVDVKTYPRRASYPDTGIDARDFDKYREFAAAHNIPVHLVWVDEIEQAVYGNRLAHLARHATQDGGKVYFPLEAMKLHRHLFPDELDRLRDAGAVDEERYRTCERHFLWPRLQARAGGR